MHRCTYSILGLAVLLAGCNSGETEQGPPKAGAESETAAQVERTENSFKPTRSASPAENDRQAKELVDAMLVRLDEQLEFLKSEIQLATSESEQQDV